MGKMANRTVSFDVVSIPNGGADYRKKYGTVRAPVTAKGRRVVGIDCGKDNMAMCSYIVEWDGKMHLEKLDWRPLSSKKKITWSDVITYSIQYVRDVLEMGRYSPDVFAIEQQVVGTKRGSNFHAMQIQVAIATTVRIQYPACNVVAVKPPPSKEEAERIAMEMLGNAPEIYGEVLAFTDPQHSYDAIYAAIGGKNKLT